MRLFLALPIPDHVKTVVQELQQHIPDETGEFSHVNPDQAHVTLKFLGDADPDNVVEQVETVDMPDFELQPHATGYFPNDNYITVYWLGFTPTPELQQLATDIDEALPEFERDHDFTPHVTIARVKELLDADTFIDATDVTIESPAFSPDAYHLVKSERSTDGAEYTILQSFQ